MDANCCFTYLHVGFPRRNHDSSHFWQIEFYNMAVNGQLSGLNCPPNVFNPHLNIHPYIIADKAYPLTTWLITPFKPNPGMQLTTDYVMFNTHHSKTRVFVERAFGILKERFQELNCKSKLKVDFLVDVSKCCAILHNFLIASKDKTLTEIKAYLGIPNYLKGEGVLLGGEVLETMEMHMYSARLNRESIMDYIKFSGRA